ncbi:flagellar hook-length control protein FliK [Variovorax sp. RCC_210]|uniref:flagellar hook-length control protein FliK n=1 Tax=Variovorax sp. RCC_210 TaxID=3239217 RepID=UPI003525171B
MPSMISPPVVANSASQPATQAGSRSRGADDTQGQGFGAALERSRANGNSQRTKTADEAGTAGTASAERKPARKPGADDDSKDALPADPNLAFLPQPNSPLHALTLAGRAAARGAAAADGAAGVSDVPVDGATAAATAATAAVTDPLAKVQATLPDAAAVAADAKAVPDADAKDLKDAAKPSATAAAAAGDGAADAAPTASIQDVVRAAVAAQAMNVGTAKPGATTASSANPAGAAGRAGPRGAVSATTAEQLASAAQPKGGEATQGTAAAVAAISAPVTAAGADTHTESGDASSGTAANPFAQQQASATAASAARAEEAAAARPSVHTIEPEVGTDKWGPALGQQLARMSTTGHHTAELNLNPAGLGPLKVTLSLGDNQAQAMFVSAHESVRKAVEAALPQLRTSLSEQGITLGQASVGADTRQASGQDAAFAQQQQQQQNAARQQTASYPGASRPGASAPVAPVAAARAAPATHASAGVDTFA